MAAPVDPLGPLRSPLRPEAASRRSHRRQHESNTEEVTNRQRGRDTGGQADRQWERHEARGQIGRGRQRRSRNNRAVGLRRDDFNGDYETVRDDSAELRLNSVVDWPVVGTVPTNENEGHSRICRGGAVDREMEREHERGKRNFERVSVKERLGKRCSLVLDNEVVRDLGQTRVGLRSQGYNTRGRRSEGRIDLGHTSQGRRCQARYWAMNRKRERNEETAESQKVGGSEADSGAVEKGRVTDWGSMVEEEEEEERMKEEALRSRSFSAGSDAGSLSVGSDAGSGVSHGTNASSRGSSVSGRGRGRGRGGKRADVPRETDEKILARRQKQLEYGMNTGEYREYRRLVPKSERTRFHPSTPDKDTVYSRRSFDTIVRIWRKSLHFWDPNNPNGRAGEGISNNNVVALRKLEMNGDNASDVLESPRKKCKQEQSDDKSAIQSQSSSDQVKQEPCIMSIKQEPMLDESSSSSLIIKPSHLDKLKIDNNDTLDLVLDEDFDEDREIVNVKEEKVKTVTDNSECELGRDVWIVKQEVMDEQLLRTEGEKSPLKTLDLNIGGVNVKAEPADEDFDMYADLLAVQ